MALALLAAACDSARTADAVPQDPTANCTRCHGYPPPANGPFLMPTTTAHPASSDCSLCHPGTVEADDVTIIPPTAGGLHMDGVVEATGGHATGYANPAQHGPDALANIASCTGCHGADYSGGCNDCHAQQVAASLPDWKANCTFCHGTRTADVTSATSLAAPPVAVDRSTTPSKVGAHQTHLVGGALRSALPCSTCHTVPTDALGHFAGYAGGSAPVTFDALAKKGAPSASYTAGSCTVYCHGNGTQGTLATDAWPIGSVAANATPAWSSSTPLACDACHASRPRTPRRIVSGVVQDVVGSGSHYSGAHNGAPCAYCHVGYVQDTSVDPALHADGNRTVKFPTRGGSVRTLLGPGWGTCGNCHDGTPDGNANAPAF